MSPLGVCPKEMKSVHWRVAWTSMCTAALFTVSFFFN
jgi:hypothetical protein